MGRRFICNLIIVKEWVNTLIYPFLFFKTFHGAILYSFSLPLLLLLRSGLSGF
jgi:hypothetical protein